MHKLISELNILFHNYIFTFYNQTKTRRLPGMVISGTETTRGQGGWEIVIQCCYSEFNRRLATVSSSEGSDGSSSEPEVNERCSDVDKDFDLSLKRPSPNPPPKSGSITVGAPACML